MRERSGSIRTAFQEHGGGAIASTRERQAERRVTGGGRFASRAGALAERRSDRAISRAV